MTSNVRDDLVAIQNEESRVTYVKMRLITVQRAILALDLATEELQALKGDILAVVGELDAGKLGINDVAGRLHSILGYPTATAEVTDAADG